MSIAFRLVPTDWRPAYWAWLVAPLLLSVVGGTRAATCTSDPFIGVALHQIVRSSPRPQVIHLADINPTAPNLRFLVTPSNGDPDGAKPDDPNLETTRETTLQFITDEHAQLGINGSFFTFVKHTLDTNDRSLVVSDGQIVSPVSDGWEWVLNITRSGNPQIRRVRPGDAVKRNSGLYNAIAGSGLLVHGGKNVAPAGTAFDDKHPPRTAVGITAGDHLLLMTVDGRQPGFSEGMSLRELAAFMLAHGAVDALNFDGGGSTTMAIADPRPRVLNFPSDHKPGGRPGKLRAVGVNLAVFAQANPRYVRPPRLALLQQGSTQAEKASTVCLSHSNLESLNN